MDIIIAKYAQSNSIEEYKKLFIKEIVSNDLYFEGFKLFVLREDFEHVCFDSDTGGKYKQKFSYRRARRMLLIPQLCIGEIPYRLIWQEDRRIPSLCVLVESLDFAMYLLPQPSEEGVFFRLGTIIAFGSKVERRIYKQLSSGVELNNVKAMPDIDKAKLYDFEAQ